MLQRRGRGHVQRAQQALAHQAESGLALSLKKRFLFGQGMSATQVQELAKLAVEDHRDSPFELQELAALGHNGDYPSHCHDQLMRILRRDLPDCPMPRTFQLTMKTLKHRDGQELEGDCDHSMVWPAEWFSYVYHRHPVAFSQRFLGCPDGHADPGTPLRNFWSSVPDTDARKTAIKAAFLPRPDVEDEEDLWSRAVPIVVHGDAFPVGRMSLDAVSWGGFLGGNLSTLASKNLISGLLSRTVGATTKAVYWGAVIYGLMMLCSGTWPHRDWNGDPLHGNDRLRAGTWIAGGLFCVIWMIKGDMDWYASTLGLGGASSVLVCPWCLANTVENLDDIWAAMFDVPVAPWNDLAATAEWRATVWRIAALWLAFHGGLRNVHPLFLLPGVSILNVMADVMHILDLGVSHYVIGNVLFQLCYYAKYFPLAPTPQARLDALFERIVVHYRGNGTPSQLQHLTLAMFCNPNGPNASQPRLTTRVKAAETRHLVPILAAVFEVVHDSTDAIDVCILLVLNSLSACYLIMDEQDYQMSPDAIAAFQRHVDTLLEEYRRLTHWAVSNDLFRWHEVPKFHYAWHIADQAAGGNPRFAWNYSDEDFMGKLQDICEHCTQATPPVKVVVKLLEKWVYGVALLLCRGR